MCARACVCVGVDVAPASVLMLGSVGGVGVVTLATCGVALGWVGVVAMAGIVCVARGIGGIAVAVGAGFGGVVGVVGIVCITRRFPCLFVIRPSPPSC